LTSTIFPQVCWLNVESTIFAFAAIEGNGMDENFEESLPASGTAIASADLLTNELENRVGPVNLSNALADIVPSIGGRGEGMMPQGSLLKIPVNVQVILGTTRMPLSKVMSLGPGSVVVLDKGLSEPVALLVNGNEVARGIIVVVDDKTGQLGISLTEISSGGSGDASSRPV
jgi:flagellar motor switch protein FliN